MSECQLHYETGTSKFLQDLRTTRHVMNTMGLAKGLLFILRLRYQAYEGLKFDRKHNVSTRGNAELTKLTISAGDALSGNRYEPCHPAIFSYGLSQLATDFGDCTFVDFGAGKGRAVFLASAYNFKEAIGVEFAEELALIMERNVARYTSSQQRCHRLRAVCGDATAFPIPDGNCVLMFFSPFRNREMLARMARSIESSLRQRPRKIYILYYYPDTLPYSVREVLDGTSSLRRRPLSFRSWRFTLLSPLVLDIYESTP